MYASEIYQDPNEENHTWVIDRPRIIIFNLKDTKAQTQSKTRNNNDLANRTFGSLYLKFISITDCAFSTEVTFPEEEDYIRRRKQSDNRDLRFIKNEPDTT